MAPRTTNGAGSVAPASISTQLLYVLNKGIVSTQLLYVLNKGIVTNEAA